jgi:hypothetical protein
MESHALPRLPIAQAHPLLVELCPYGLFRVEITYLLFLAGWKGSAA